MQNTLKARNIKYWIATLFFLAGLSHALACDLATIRKSDKSVYDVLCDQNGTPNLYLKYSSKQSKVWIESADKKTFKLIKKVERSHNDDHIETFLGVQFVAPSVSNLDNQKFIGLVYSERSMRGSGGGQCGAGSEDFFIALQKNGHRLREKKRFLIASCIKSIELKSDEVETGRAISAGNDTVIFKWLNYPPYDKTATGKYSFLRNTLTVIESKTSYEWEN
jgi:hypothetical protein